MADRPILFSGPMIRALLAGTKTQTRRVMKPQPDADARFFAIDVAINMKGEPAGVAAWFLDSNDGGLPPIFCPYGQPGDRLWVRETWARDDEDGCLMYRADVGHDMTADAWEQGRIEGVPRYRWRPSIHMPRWASRITLEVTGVRVERLQDISEADAAAEGCPCYVCSRIMDGTSEDDCHCFHRKGGKTDYRNLWESINGPGSWDANPHVWAVEFKRVTP